MRPWKEYDKLKLAGAVIGSILLATGLSLLGKKLVQVTGVDFFAPLGATLGFVIIFLVMKLLLDGTEHLLKPEYRSGKR